jgi:DNA-binding transcriptional ArsR family regulator
MGPRSRPPDPEQAKESIDVAKRKRPELLEGLPAGRWTEAQWTCLMSPARLAILQILDSVKDFSASELARASGRRAESLYPHLEALAAAGLIEFRASGANAGRRYAISEVGRSSPVDYETGAGMSRIARVIEMQARESARKARRVAEMAETDSELAREFYFVLQVGWLDEAKLARFQKILRELREMCVGSESDPSGQRFLLEVKCFRDLSLPDVRAIKAKRRKAERAEADRSSDVQDPPATS